MAELARLPDTTMITVRCHAAVLDATVLPLGLAFPRAANRFLVSAANTVVWTGPDDWLVIAEDNATGLRSSLEQAFAGHHAAIVDTSGNRVRLALSGDGARDMMARACALDFDPPHFVAGHCAGTMVARAQAYVLQRTPAPVYEIVVRRSLSLYLQDWFAAAGCNVI